MFSKKKLRWRRMYKKIQSRKMVKVIIFQLIEGLSQIKNIEAYLI